MHKITSSVKTGGLLIFLLVFTLSFILASTKNSVAGLIVTKDQVENVSCFNLADGSINVSITGGDGNYTYSWTGPGSFSSSSKNISGLPAGTYSLEVNDGSGNSGDIIIVIDQPDALTMALPSSTPVSCNGGNDGTTTAGAVSGGNGGYQYKLDAGIFGTSNSFSGLTAGTYTITVKDSKNCETSQAVTVTQPDALTMALPTSTPVSCNGGNDGTATAGAVSGGNGGYQYKLDAGIFGTSNSFSGLTAGTYTITVKDSKNCETSQAVTITQPDALTMATPTSTPVSCNGGNDGTATAGAVSGGNGGYQYKLDAGIFGTSNSFSGLTAGTYTITVKDSKNCETSQAVTITQPDALTMATPTSTPVSCNGGNDGTATAGAVSGGNGGYQYKLDAGIFGTSNSFSGLTAGTYTITVKDSKNCETSQAVTITQPDALTMATPTSTPVSCNGGNDGTATAGAVSGGNGGYQYKLDAGIYGTSNSFSGLTAGTYTITVKDSKNCESSQAVTVTQPDTLTMATPTSTPVSCNGGNDGTATAGNVSGGNSAFQYSIDGGVFSTSKTFTGLIAGNHTITVKDNKGCEASETITISEPAPLTATSATFTPVSCSGGSDGTITAGTPTGANGNYLYALDNGTFSSSTTFSNLSAGSYKLKIKDSKNCELIQNIVVTEPAPLSMTEPSSTEATCFGGADGTITVGTMSGGNGNYEYSLDNTNFTTSTTFTGLTAGNYTIFVKDENGCSLQKNISITQPNILNASLSKTNIACYGENTGNITISAPQGGHGNYEYSIDGSNWQAGASFNNLYSGNYSIFIRDTAYPSCVVNLNDNYVLTQPAAELTAEVTTTRTTSYGSASGTATANPAGGTPGYTYQWREAGSSEVIQTTKTATNLLAGDYEVTVTDIKGCTFTQNITIIDAIEAFIASRSVCEDEGDQSAIRTSYFEVNNQTAIGGIGPYTYSWDFGNGATNPTRTGIGEHTVYYSSTGNKTITLVVTDSTGKTFTVTQQNYVGNCYEPCGKSENFVFDPNNIYIGDENGNILIASDPLLCDNTVNKYIYIAVDKSANAYNPYIELIYKISNTNEPDGTTVSYAGGCRSGDDIDDDPNDNKENKIGGFIKLTLAPIDFQCGDNLDIENFYVTWTNVEHKKCGQNNNAFCYSQDEPVILPTPLAAVAKPTHILCKGDSTGSISTSVSGGYAPYTFNLTGPNASYEASNTFHNIPAGDHTVYVRDSRGNTTSVTTTINEPSTSISASTTVVNPICFGETGSATVSATGGTPFEDGTYEYLWNDPSEQTTATATDLVAGDYTVTIIDANGCQVIKTVSITQPEELTIAETGEDQTFSCGFNSTSLEANTPDTGTGEWTIISGTGGTIAEPSNPNSEFTGTNGSYTLRWTISHPDGTCATTSDLSVTFSSDCSTLDFDGINDHVVMGDNYPLSSGPFSIEVWVKPKSVSGVKTVLSKRDYSNLTAGGFDLIINNGAPTFRWKGNSVSTSSKVATNRWYHLAVIYKNSNVELYVDGIKVGNSTASNPGTTAAPFLLGGIFDSSNSDIPKNHYHGWMEELRIWKTALSPVQLRFMMNQRLQNNAGNAKGEILPMDVPGSLAWSDLTGYYRLIPNEIVNGETLDISASPVNGYLINIETTQKNTAPLPYISEAPGSWRNRSTWDTNIGNDNENWWDVPNGKGINGDFINWNIAKISHNINSTAQNIYMLGLLSESGELLIDGDISSETGQGLTITKYLQLNGNINLEGQSQLVQTEGSILEEASSGYIEIDQQGTANSFNYNYWTSPVSITGAPNNSGYRLKDVLFDGTDPDNLQQLNFNSQYHWADHDYSGAKRISTYWLHTFQGTADNYFEWHRFSEADLLDPAIGYSMKGTTGYVPVSNRQNYIFKGKPNNGDITVAVGKDQNLLTGNPYPSAIDAQQFIEENLSDFNGSLYFWDHFGPVNSHYLEEYVGGYAVYNLSGGIASASSVDSRIDATGDQSQKGPPKRYIPVGQAFFINTVGASSPNSVTFKNKYRAFVKESSGDSQFHMQETPEKGKENDSYATDNRFKIRLKYESPKGYHRQILVTADANTTGGFDLGYDAPLIENNVEDMYWMIDDTEFVIQAVPHFNTDQVLPIGIKISEKGEYTIKVDELENLKSDFKIYLRDKINDIYYDLAEGPFKTTAEETGFFNDLYDIVFKQPGIEIPEKEEPVTGPEILDGITLGLQYLTNTDEIAIVNPDLIKVDYVELFSISGQLIKTFREVPSSRAILLAIDQKLSSAVYIVKVHSGEKSYSEKVIIKK